MNRSGECSSNPTRECTCTCTCTTHARATAHAPARALGVHRLEIEIEIEHQHHSLPLSRLLSAGFQTQLPRKIKDFACPRNPCRTFTVDQDRLEFDSQPQTARAVGGAR